MTDNEKLLRRMVLDARIVDKCQMFCPNNYGLTTLPCAQGCKECWERALDRFLESGQEK